MPLVFLYLFGVGYPFGGGEARARCGGAAMWSRPFGATMCKGWVEQLGGAPAGAQSYWQGRFAACAFVAGFLGIGRTRNSWGVAPNPTRELRPLTPPKGLRPSGLPFARLSWLLLHALPACLSFWRCDLVLFPFPFNPHESLSSPRAQSRVSSVHPPSSQYNPMQIY